MADPWYGAQSMRRMKFAVVPFDFAAESTELAFQQAHAIDLDGGFQLQVFKIDCIPMKASRLHCSRFEAVYQLSGQKGRYGDGYPLACLAMKPSRVVLPHLL